MISLDRTRLTDNLITRKALQQEGFCYDETMGETLCQLCTAACCKGGPDGSSMTLWPAEHKQMKKAGTKFITVAEPVDYDRPNVPYPVGFERTEDGGVRILTLKGREMEPLAAGMGRYLMIGNCKNLVEVDGHEQCGIYEDRPEICRKFPMGGAACHYMRQRDGLEPDL